MNKLIKGLAVSLILSTMAMSKCFGYFDGETKTDIDVFVPDPVQYVEDDEPELIEYEELEQSEQVDEQESEDVPSEDIQLLALVTMAEAEGESDYGKRLVISTILNRVDSEYFPNTIKEVIYQPNQFTSMWNGRADRVEITPDVLELVKSELQERTNYEVMFFTAGSYGQYGEPMFQVENHYFAKY